MNHGSTAGTARPAGAGAVDWYGSVTPTNAITDDRWWDTTAELWKRLNSAGAWIVAGARPSLLPATIRPAPVTMITAFQTGHSGVARAGSTGTINLNDTTDAALGTQCVSMLTNGAGGNCQLDYSPITAYDLTSNAIEFWLKVDSATAANLLTLNLFVGETLTTGYSVDILFGTTPAAWTQPTGRWFKVAVDLSFASTFNTPTTKTALTAFRLTAKDRGAGAAKVYVGGAALVPKPTTKYPNGVITIGFDDGYADQFTTARPRMDRYGFPATAYIIQDLLDVVTGNTYMTLAQLHQLEDLSGWEMAAHSYTAAAHNATGAFTSLSDSALRSDMEAHKLWMMQEGFRGRDHVAYPQGLYTDSTVAVINDYFSTGRTTASANATGQAAGAPDDPLRMHCYPIDSGLSLATLTALVDKVKSERCWFQFYTHRVLASGATGTQTSTTTFNGLIDYIATAGVPVRTVSDVLALR